MKRNSKLMKKVISFCEELNALVKKVDEAKDLVEELKSTTEDEATANFSVKMNTKLRKLKKHFCEGELKEDLDEVKVDGDELTENEELAKVKSFGRIIRSLKRFSDDMLELKGDISKASAAAASEVEPPKAPVALDANDGANSSANTDGAVVAVASVNEAAPEATDSDGKIIEPEALNFSKVRKMHLQKVFSDFENICEHCEDISEGIETFTNDLIADEGEDNVVKEVEASAEEIKEPVTATEDFCGGKKSFCGDADGLKKLEDKVEALATDVHDVMTKEGFCKEDKMEAGDKFKAFCECLDGLCSGDKSAEEAVDALEAVEMFCKNLSKKINKFSSKKAFCGIMKAFDELPELVDAIEVNTTEVGTVDDPAKTETFCDEKISEQDASINEKIDDLDKLEAKVQDEKLVAFSKMTRKALKSMKCFSEEDLEAKAGQVNELADTLENASKCPECGAEIPDDNAEKTEEEKKDENFSEEEKKDSESEEKSEETKEETTDEGKTEETESTEDENEEEDTKEMIEQFAKEDGETEAKTETPATEEEEKKDDEQTEEVSTEDTETTDVTENADFTETESEDAVLSNSDLVNDVMAESNEDPAEVQDSAPVTPIANFSKQTSSTVTKKSSYGTWLANQANHM